VRKKIKLGALSLKKKIILGALSVLLVLLIGATGLTGYVYYTYKNAIEGNHENAFEKPKDVIFKPPITDETDTEEKGTEGEQQIEPEENPYIYNKDILNILVLGYDDYELRQKERGSASYRSDVIILASINMKTKEAFMVSVPRDTRTLVKKRDKNGGVKEETFDKIGHASAYNGGKRQRGFENACDAVSNLMGGIPVDYYVAMNLDDFIRIVDAIGGVPLNVEVDIPLVGLTKGQQVLKGKKALGYVRERKIPGQGGGDIERTKRQKKFVLAFLQKVKSMGAVDIATKLFPSAVTYIDTNLNFEQVITLATMLMDMDLSKIETYTIPGESKMLDLSYWIVDKEKLKELLYDKYFLLKEEESKQN